MTQNLQLALDSAILSGSGSSGEPTGILETSGVNSIAVGTNGGAVTADMLINLEGNVVIDNGVVNPSATKYITNGKVVNDLKKLKDSNNQYLYNLNYAVGGRGPTPANFNGYPILDSMQVPSTLTKGSSSNNCSAVIFGDFSQCLLCLWGGLEIQVGEDSDDFSKLLSSVRGVLSMDVVVRNPVSFGVIKDITTTL
jgi:HK97 family phage major capsid protein